MHISSPVPLDLPGAVQSGRRAGFAQGIMLLLPMTMAVMGVSVLMPVVHLLLEHFKDVPNYEYLVMGGVVTMPSIWILLLSPAASSDGRSGPPSSLVPVTAEECRPTASSQRRP